MGNDIADVLEIDAPSVTILSMKASGPTLDVTFEAEDSNPTIVEKVSKIAVTDMKFASAATAYGKPVYGLGAKVVQPDPAKCPKNKDDDPEKAKKEVGSSVKAKAKYNASADNSTAANKTAAQDKVLS